MILLLAECSTITATYELLHAVTKWNSATLYWLQKALTILLRQFVPIKAASSVQDRLTFSQHVLSVIAAVSLEMNYDIIHFFIRSAFPVHFLSPICSGH